MYRLIFVLIAGLIATSAQARDVHTENAWLEWAGHGVYPDDLTFVDYETPNEHLRIGDTITSAEAVGIDTNDAAFISWYAARKAAQDAPSIALAAEVASLESDLTNAVFVAFGVMPPYSKNVQATYRASLRTQMAQARGDLDAATTAGGIKAAQNKLNQRQHIINLIRELMALDPAWDLSDLQ